MAAATCQLAEHTEDTLALEVVATFTDVLRRWGYDLEALPEAAWPSLADAQRALKTSRYAQG